MTASNTQHARVLVRLADSDAREAAREALSAQFAPVVEDPAAVPAPADGAAVGGDERPAALARAWSEAGHRCVVLDYRAEDAASVKLLQAATERPDAPRLVFVLPPDAKLDRSQFLMAVNEGAFAILESPLDGQALATYVGRAVSGPGRFRGDAAKGNSDSQVWRGGVEEMVRKSREQVVACERLISRLLSTPASGQARRVLIVSDSPFQREQLEKLLREHGFHVWTAGGAGEALETALREKPRIVVSDLEMAEFDGVELCRRLKIEHKFVPCHFVICTANRDRMAAIMTPGNGVDDCMPKPSDPAEVLDFVARVAMGLLL